MNTIELDLLGDSCLLGKRKVGYLSGNTIVTEGRLLLLLLLLLSLAHEKSEPQEETDEGDAYYYLTVVGDLSLTPLLNYSRLLEAGDSATFTNACEFTLKV